MKMIGDHIQWPKVPCCTGEEECCVCPNMERALRGWRRSADGMPPMTAEQREFCLDEIGRVEGYVRAEHVGETDAALATSTISAWIDYARDKGLIR